MSVLGKVMRLFGGGHAGRHCASPALDAALARLNQAEAALHDSSERAMAASRKELNASRTVTMVVEASNEAMRVDREQNLDPARQAARAAMRRLGGGHAPDRS